MNIVNGPGRYIDTIKLRQWPQPFNNQMGPEMAKSDLGIGPYLYLLFIRSSVEAPLEVTMWVSE